MSTAVTPLHPALRARDAEVHPATRTLFRAAAAVAVATVATGAINEATGSGFACETWPGCFHGRFAPHPEAHQLIEFGHRSIAGLCVVTVLASAVLALRLPHEQRLARRLPWVAMAGIAGSAVFGALTVVNLGLARPLSVLDLFCALVTMVAMTLATLSLERGAPTWQWTPTSRLAAVTASAIVVLHLLGSTVTGTGSFTSVLGWPLRWSVPGDVSAPLQGARMVLAVATGVLVLALAWRVRAAANLRLPVFAAVGLLVLELVVGRIIVASGVSMALGATYGTLAALLFFAVLLVAGRAGLD